MHLVDAIVAQTADVFQRKPEELVGRSRKRPIVEARQAAMWAIRRRYPSVSLETIGAALGGRHYTTVTHALAAVEQRANRNAISRGKIQRLMERVSSLSRLTPLVTSVAPCWLIGSQRSVPTWNE
jgi:chromosomal replication initiator protein